MKLRHGDALGARASHQKNPSGPFAAVAQLPSQQTAALRSGALARLNKINIKNTLEKL